MSNKVVSESLLLSVLASIRGRDINTPVEPKAICKKAQIRPNKSNEERVRNAIWLLRDRGYLIAIKVKLPHVDSPSGYYMTDTINDFSDEIHTIEATLETKKKHLNTMKKMLSKGDPEKCSQKSDTCASNSAPSVTTLIDTHGVHLPAGMVRRAH